MERMGYEMVRYADDSVILCKTKEEAKRALEEIKGMLEEKGLVLHPDKTKIVDATREGGEVKAFSAPTCNIQRYYCWDFSKN